MKRSRKRAIATWVLSVFELQAAAMLNAQNQTQGYRQKVMQAMIQQLQGEVPNIEAIARSLMISVRQLQRELQAENTSYQQLLDKTRKELALRHLKNLETSIHDVAFSWGFRSRAPFPVPSNAGQDNLPEAIVQPKLGRLRRSAQHYEQTTRNLVKIPVI